MSDYETLEDEASSDAQWQTSEIRSAKPNWSSFAQSKLISEADSTALGNFTRKSLESQGTAFCEDSAACAKAFIAVLKGVSNKEALRYILTTLDELCKENREIGPLFVGLAGTDLDPIDVVSQLVSRDDEIMVGRACHVTAHLLAARVPSSAGTTKKLMDYVRVELQRDGKTLVYQSKLTLLQGLLRSHDRRVAFVEARGIEMLSGLLRDSKNHGNTQMIYQSSVCLWLLSYSNGIKEKLVNMEIVSILVQVMKGTTKDKVIRMILAIMVNLVETGQMKSLLSVCGCLRILDSMSQRSWSDDDIKNDIDALIDKVGQNVEQSSTFDQYCKELMSGELEWTPMHKSGNFWEKNVHKFLEKDQQVLKLLVALIKPGEKVSAKVLSVALHDLGEFVRYHPGGKANINKMGAKVYIMTHLTSEEPEVSKEALSCVQKLMVS
jgi:V-type H+-transporting ATPase subunit H